MADEDGGVRNAKDAVHRLRDFEGRSEDHADAIVRISVSEIRVVREWILNHELDTLSEKTEQLQENKKLHERIDKKMDKAPVYYIGGALTTLVIVIAGAFINTLLGVG